jgi:hypothetical protein
MSSTADDTPRAARPARRWTLVRMIALLITAVSILAAIAAWRASVVSGDAGGLDQRATQERVRKQQIEGQLDAQVDQDLRLFPRYLGHLRTYEVLKKRAEQRKENDEQLADDLRRDAIEEIALARTIYQALYIKPQFGADTYDEEYARNYMRLYNLDLASLDPDEALELAQDERRRGTTLVGVTAVFIGALFFLTLAQVGRRMARRGFAAAGVLLMVGASVAFAVVGM